MLQVEKGSLLKVPMEPSLVRWLEQLKEINLATLIDETLGILMVLWLI